MPVVDRRKIWREAVFSLRGMGMAVLGALLAVAGVLAVQRVANVRAPRIEVNWLDKPFVSKSMIESPVPVLNESKIAGTTQGVNPGQPVWVFLCNSNTEECHSHRLLVFQNGDWEDSIRVGDESQVCLSFSAQFVLLDDTADKSLRSRPTARLLRADLPTDHFLDADVFVVRLVSDDQSCTAATVPAGGGS